MKIPSTWPRAASSTILILLAILSIDLFTLGSVRESLPTLFPFMIVLIVWEIIRRPTFNIFWHGRTLWFVCGGIFVIFCPLGHVERWPVAAHESSAISTLRTISAAEETFKSAKVKDEDFDGNGEYGTLAELAGLVPPRGKDTPVSPAFISADLASGIKEDYLFQVLLGCSACGDPCGVDARESRWIATARPVTYGHPHGRRSFCVDASGVIRGSDVGGNEATCSAMLGDDAWPAIGG